VTIHYTIKPVHPEAHLFDVSLQVSQPNQAGQCLTLPNWIPGSYMIRDFSRNIVHMEASSDACAIALQKINKSCWQAPPGLTELTVSYRVYAWDLSVRAAHLDTTHAFFNGTSVFLCVDGQEDKPVSVTLNAPSGVEYGNWQVATSLRAGETNEAGFGLYEADDYDELIDHPVEMGTIERVLFDACGVPHELVLTGNYHTDTDRIVKDLKCICEYQIRFFGEPAPVDRYVFLVTVVGKGYGGLEHRASTALLVTRDNLPVPGEAAISDSYLDFLGLCSHEYFHTWNVKRMKPAVFMPYELNAESYTRLLWFFEGVTSYYDDLALVRCGLIDAERYLTLLAKTLTRVQRGAGRLSQSVTDSSFDAWHKFYKQDENAPNAIVSYYAKGSLVALCLDAELRKSGDGERSLDELMATLWQRWLSSGEGLSEREPEVLATDLAGTQLDSFFNDALYSTKELPLEEALASLGVLLSWRQRNSTKDMGSVIASNIEQEMLASKDSSLVQTSLPSDESASLSQPWIGANLVSEGSGVRLTHVFSQGAAEKAGLAAGDIIVALERVSVTVDTVPTLLARYASVTSVTIHYFRHGMLSEAHLPIQLAPADTCSLSIQDNDRLVAWLGTAR